MALQPFVSESQRAMAPAAPQAAQFIERRWAARKPSMAAAAIRLPDNSVPIPCLVRDVSTTGAKIELVTGADNLLGGRVRLPPKFTLQIKVDRMEVDCAIVWRKSEFVGVRYLSTPRPVSRVNR